jgi:hypothetical protein
MKKPAAKIFLFFYVTFTFLVQAEHTRVWLSSLEISTGSLSPGIQAQSQLSRQYRIAESGFILRGVEDAIALPEVVSEVTLLHAKQPPAPCLLNIPPRSPPENFQVA